VCKESGNLNLEREFQVRGVVYCVLIRDRLNMYCLV